MNANVIPLLARGRDRLETAFRAAHCLGCVVILPYSLGDAIDWKHWDEPGRRSAVYPLLARGRDRLETGKRLEKVQPQ